MRQRLGLILVVVLRRCHVRDEQDEGNGAPSFQHFTKRRTVVHLLPPVWNAAQTTIYFPQEPIR